jgi:hypothetical protein
MSKELKKCPFCGGEADNTRFIDRASCTLCEATGPSDMQQGGALWNNRFENENGKEEGEQNSNAVEFLNIEVEKSLCVLVARLDELLGSVHWAQAGAREALKRIMMLRNEMTDERSRDK